MQIIRCTPQEYKDAFPTPSHVFNSVEFNELNRHKCEDVHYLLFKDDKGKVRFGIILGQKDGLLKSPFSAPFGGMEARGCQRVDYYVDAVGELRRYALGLGKKIRVIIPPSAYASNSNIEKQINALLTNGGNIEYSDYNYSYTLDDFQAFNDNLWPNARRNLKASMRLPFEFVKGEGREFVADVYRVVKLNHDEHGYPVHMSLDDVMDTVEMACMADFFQVKLDGELVASAMIYLTSSSVAQLIYWGDDARFRDMRPMNFLAYKLLEYYHKAGFGSFDFGPSSSDGIPSLGLCNFKESLGCHMTPKFTIEL